MPTIYGMREAQHKSDLAAPPVEWRHLQFWGLLIVIVLALALLAAVL